MLSFSAACRMEGAPTEELAQRLDFINSLPHTSQVESLQQCVAEAAAAKRQDAVLLAIDAALSHRVSASDKATEHLGLGKLTQTALSLLLDAATDAPRDGNVRSGVQSPVHWLQRAADCVQRVKATAARTGATTAEMHEDLARQFGPPAVGAWHCKIAWNCMAAAAADRQAQAASAMALARLLDAMQLEPGCSSATAVKAYALWIAGAAQHPDLRAEAQLATIREAQRQVEVWIRTAQEQATEEGGQKEHPCITWLDRCSAHLQQHTSPVQLKETLRLLEFEILCHTPAASEPGSLQAFVQASADAGAPSSTLVSMGQVAQAEGRQDAAATAFHRALQAGARETDVDPDVRGGMFIGIVTAHASDPQTQLKWLLQAAQLADGGLPDEAIAQLARAAWMAGRQAFHLNQWKEARPLLEIALKLARRGTFISESEIAALQHQYEAFVRVLEGMPAAERAAATTRYLDIESFTPATSTLTHQSLQVHPRRAEAARRGLRRMGIEVTASSISASPATEPPAPQLQPAIRKRRRSVPMKQAGSPVMSPPTPAQPARVDTAVRVESATLGSEASPVVSPAPKRQATEPSPQPAMVALSTPEVGAGALPLRDHAGFKQAGEKSELTTPPATVKPAQGQQPESSGKGSAPDVASEADSLDMPPSALVPK